MFEILFIPMMIAIILTPVLLLKIGYSKGSTIIITAAILLIIIFASLCFYMALPSMMMN